MMTDKPPLVPPGGTIGILGGGQLGRMLALAAADLGIKACIFANDPQSPAFDVAGAQVCAQFDDLAAIEDFAAQVDVATFEFENIPTQTLTEIAKTKPVLPDASVLQITNDRVLEKQFINEQNIATARYWPIDNLVALESALNETGGTGIMKTRRFGYDGKGQVRIKRLEDAAKNWADIGESPAILEEIIPFDREISVVLARRHNGETAIYDPSENHHENHILSTTTVPAKLGNETMERAIEIAIKIADALDYIGVLAVELFVETIGTREHLRVNEIAPRVHNSGHWTMDGALTSQFEQHIRSVCGWPLGAVDRSHDVIMTNLIGNDVDRWAEFANTPDTRLHLYGKREPRPGRKMGHVTQITPRADKR